MAGSAAFQHDLMQALPCSASGVGLMVPPREAEFRQFTAVEAAQLASRLPALGRGEDPAEDDR
jgi:hypothetical protein